MAKPAVIQPDLTQAEDFSEETILIPRLRKFLRESGFTLGEWSIKENAKKRTIVLTAERSPWTQTAMFEGDGEEADGD